MEGGLGMSTYSTGGGGGGGLLPVIFWASRIGAYLKVSAYSNKCSSLRLLTLTPNDCC